MPTNYEWSIETVDEYHDIIDSDFSYSLNDITCKPDELNKNYRLVLVRDVIDKYDSLQDRTWGYVDLENMTLPVYTKDAFERLSDKIPKKYHEELKRWITAYNKRL